MDRLALGVVAAALVAGQLACAAPREVAGAGLIVALTVAWRRRRPVLAIASVVLLLLACWRARMTVRAHEDARATVLANGPRPFDGRVVVVSSPVEMHGTMRFHARPIGEPAGLPAAVDDLLLYGGPADVARGDELVVTAHLSLPERFWNESDPRPAAARAGSVLSGGSDSTVRVSRGRGIGALIDRARASVRRRIEATFRPDEAPLARALVLGEDDLAPEDSSAFRTSGLSHLLAVSGMHLILVVAGTMAVIRAILVRVGPLARRMDIGRLVAVGGAPLAFVYASFAGGSGSALRAAWMAGLVAAARVWDRRAEPPRALALSVIAMALVDPLVAFDVSFGLSVAATLGLLVLGPPLAHRLEARLRLEAATGTGPSTTAAANAERQVLVRLLARALAIAKRAALPVVRAFAATLAASLSCAPILAGFAPTLPVGGALANLLAVPLGEIAALPLCLAHACLSFWPDAERGTAQAAGAALAWLRVLATWFAARANVPVPDPTALEMAVAVAAGAIFASSSGVARRVVVALGAVAMIGCELRTRAEGAPEGKLRVTYLDVGQGDSALIDLPDGEAMLIDGGGLVGSPVDVGARVLLPVLRARRRSRLAVVVLTHPHPDHFLGLVTLLGSSIEVGELWDSGQGEREAMGGGYARLVEEARRRGAGLTVKRPADLCGTRSLGGARVEVLAPCPDVDGDHDPNDNSLVLRLSSGRRSFLFVGDAERAEERQLLATGLPLAADVLKVGHHGSRTSSSPDFVAVVSPRVAVISAGVRNRFGHPHPETLATFAALASRAGTTLLRTDRDGAVQISTDGVDLRLDSAAEAP